MTNRPTPDPLRPTPAGRRPRGAARRGARGGTLVAVAFAIAAVAGLVGGPGPGAASPAAAAGVVRDASCSVTPGGVLSCSASSPGSGSPGGGPPGTPAPKPACTYTLASTLPASKRPAGPTHRVHDGQAQDLYRRNCKGKVSWVWGPSPKPPGGPSGTTSATTTPPASDDITKTLPPPVWSTPADTDRWHLAYVQTPTYFWVDDATWQPISGEVAAGSAWADVVASPVRLVVDPGDGRPPVVCEGRPPAYVRGTPTATFPGCAHVYRHSSAVAPGRQYAVTVSLVWHVTWTGSDGAGGDLGEVTTSAAPRGLRVAEIQAVVTG